MKHGTQLRVHPVRRKHQAALAHHNNGPKVEHAAASVANSRSLREQEPQSDEATVCLLVSAVTQVLEPAALDAVYSSADQTYHVLVPGRGTQLLSMRTAD